MPFLFTFSLLLVGSGMMTFRVPEPIRPYREHIGLILLLYGFGNFLAYLGEFFQTVELSPLFAITKMSMWVLTLVIGFVLAYPLLDKHLFQQARGLEEQGRRVFEGFDGMRIVLGTVGLVVASLMMMSQLQVI